MPVIVKIAYVNPPQQGRKNGSIKTDTGEFYGVPPAMLSQFTQGGTYSVEYGERIYNGRTYKDIKSASMINAPSGGGRQTDDVTSERIFVCGAINSALQSGQLNIGDEEAVTHAVAMLRSVWARTFGGRSQAAAQQGRQQQQMPPRGDMDDQIPF